jgi:multimeric flavodoxin WrbA
MEHAMKTLTILGSYRKHGNTARAAALILAEMQTLAAMNGVPLENETLFLCDLDLANCRGCRSCFNRGEAKCPLKDDTLAVYEKMRAADGLIIASPIYVDDVSGLTKTWIDRLAFLCHRPALGRQSALLVTTVAGSPHGHAQGTLRTALLTWGAHIAGTAGFNMGALMPDNELATLRPRAAQAARRLFNALVTRAHERPDFLSLMMFRIQQISWKLAEPGSVDHRHWQENGWLEESQSFYFPHRAPWLVRVLARRVGEVVLRLVT